MPHFGYQMWKPVLGNQMLNYQRLHFLPENQNKFQHLGD
jgi:hypothetical protein